MSCAQVTSDGFTVVSPAGSPVTAALNWGDFNQDEGLYELFLASMLADGQP